MAVKDDDPIVFRTPSMGSTCIEVALVLHDGQVDEVLIRDSKDRSLPAISINYDLFKEIEASPRPGAFSCGGSTLVVTSGPGLITMCKPESGNLLSFTEEEWSVFVDGCRSGFFEPSKYDMAAA